MSVTCATHVMRVVRRFKEWRALRMIPLTSVSARITSKV